MVLRTLLHRAWPPTPPEIGDDLALLRYRRVKQHAPLLYLAIIVSGIATAVFSMSEISFVQRVAAPSILVIFGLARMLAWGMRTNDVTAETAKSRLAGAKWATLFLSALCSLWCVSAWIELDAPHRIYVPIFLALGALAATMCFTSYRLAAILVLLVGLGPISSLMLASPDPMHVALGLSIICTSTMQARMIMQVHSQMISALVLQRQTRHSASTDPLTGLPNRRALYGMIQEHLASARSQGSAAVALLDLDGFKPVNDRLGHQAGDELLVIVAERLKTAAGDYATVGRIGGDEFAFFIPVPGDDATLSARTTAMIAAIALPCSIAGRRVTISGSLGYARFPQDGRDLTALLGAADQALYAAKSAQRPVQSRQVA